MRAEPLGADHPAERYRLYHETATEQFAHAVKQAQDAVDYPPRYRSLWLRPDVELNPGGQSWVCSLELALSPHPDEYWWDLARATDVLAAVARGYQVPLVLLSREKPRPVTDPLWHHGWAALNARRAGQR